LQERSIRSGFYQMHNITSDRNSLLKDDRIDALSGLVRHLNSTLVLDEEAEQVRRAKEEAMQFFKGLPGLHQDFNKRSRASPVARRRRRAR
jgi:hypothetical protein